MDTLKGENKELKHTVSSMEEEANKLKLQLLAKEKELQTQKNRNKNVLEINKQVCQKKEIQMKQNMIKVKKKSSKFHCKLKSQGSHKVKS